MIDKRPFGGTCALRGCDPKKVLVGAASAIDAARRLSGKGVKAVGLAIDWPELIRFKRTFTDRKPDQLKASLARDGIVALEGTARFADRDRIQVGESTLVARRAIVIAAGARPADLAIDGREHVITSEQFLDLPSLPASVAFVGGGYISFEFAHVAARAGSHVTILHRGARPLGEFDADLVDRLVDRTRALGADVRLSTEVRAIRVVDGRYRIVTGGDATSTSVDADLVVHGAGRVPELDDLAPGDGGVRASTGGIAVNEYLQSVSNPLVYAAGDCADTDGPALTPVASYEGRIVAANLLEGNHVSGTYDAIPSVVFTEPPLARVGLREDEARAKGLAFVSHRQDMSGWYSSRRAGETFAESHVLIERSAGTILGAHLLGPQADETINLFALAIRSGVTADRLKEILWAYPTHASDTPYLFS